MTPQKIACHTTGKEEMSIATIDKNLLIALLLFGENLNVYLLVFVAFT